ncbi:hypothetical protein BJV77DRAFT_978733 [Russula vinacea]|nr:hypothetical protein BJV77DRAFT_978733 [Russula vinacea]
MPHKRAKQSVREQKRKERGADLAPPGNTGNGAGISTERIPKSAARVLDAAKIRAEYRQKQTSHGRGWCGHREEGRGTREGEGEKNFPVDTIEIQPGESLSISIGMRILFSQITRVEDHMRPLVQSAIRASAATERKERKTTTTTTTTTSSKAKSQPYHHQLQKPPAAPRRLNDIATAPPELKRLPRGATTRTQRGGGGSDGGGKAKAGKAGVLSMAQRVMMEAERENVIRRYREMKERKVEEDIFGATWLSVDGAM